MNGLLTVLLVLCVIATIFCVTMTFVQRKYGDKECASFCFAGGIVCFVLLILISLAKYNINDRQGTYTVKDGKYIIYIDGDRTTYRIDTLKDKVFTSSGYSDTSWSIEEFEQILKDRGLTERK